MAQPISFVPLKPGERVDALLPEDEFPLPTPLPTTPNPVATPSVEAKITAAPESVSAVPRTIAPTIMPPKAAPAPEAARPAKAAPAALLPKEPALIAPPDKKTSARKVVKTIAKIFGIIVLIALLALAGLYYWGSRLVQQEPSIESVFFE